MIGRIWNLARKEFVQLVRDRMMALFLVLLPLAQLVLLAQATGQGLNDLPLGIVDHDCSYDSRRLSEALDNLRELDWRFLPMDEADLVERLDRGQAVVGVVIPAGFGAALAGDDTVPAVQVLVDGTNSVTALTAKSAVEGTVANYARRVVESHGYTAAGTAGLANSVRYNPALNTRLYTIPAQMGFIIYQVTLAVASLAFARERELGTLEQLLVTPLRRFELIAGKSILAWLVGVTNFLLMYAVVTLVFEVPLRGSFTLLLALSMLFIAVQICYGILISSFARTQQQAVLYVFMLAMLDVALSGYLVPVANMPGALQVVARISPLQHYLVIIRSIMLKGAGLAVLWPDVAALVGVGCAAGLAALATATRSLD